MGANQSSATGGSGTSNSNTVKTCYYDLLAISPSATDDDIKKAYRKRALELHPDRNYGNVEATTQQFAEVQSAYEVLSDPQERAWYDSHRSTILSGIGDVLSASYEHNLRMTTVHDILQLFGKFNSRIEFSDSPNGFYGALREVFVTLAKEEESASRWDGIELPAFPSFGYANDDYQSTVKPFYATWTGFWTRKSFSWKDIYRYSDAPDRRVRRLMEKENKRFREEGIREFNDAVRSLVVFARKRDPRVEDGKDSEVDRERVLKEAAAAQAARSRAANQAKATQVDALPEWIKSTELEDSGLFDQESEASSREEFECVLCDKIFKSEKQFDVHERSKKHLKAVRQVQKEMWQDDEGLALEDNTNIDNRSPGKHPEAHFGDDAELLSGLNSKKLCNDALREKPPVKQDLEKDTNVDAHQGLQSPSAYSDRSSDEGEQGPDTNTESPSSGLSLRREDADNPRKNDDLDSLNKKLASKSLEDQNKPRLGKAKEKRAKKAAQKAALSNAENEAYKCATCQAGFPSKTRLFNHIKDFGHASQVSQQMRKGRPNKK